MRITIPPGALAQVEVPAARHGWLRDFLTMLVIEHDEVGNPIEVVESLLSDDGTSFGAGLAPMLARAWERETRGPAKTGARAEVVDQRPPLANMPIPEWLRSDQAGAVQAVRDSPVPGRGIIQARPGWGKSTTACAFPVCFGGRWIFLVHRDHLARDVAARFESLTGEPAGRIGDGRWDATPDHRFIAASLQTLNARLDTSAMASLVLDVDGVVLDECHVGAARSFRTVLERFDGASWWVGLSATPLDRADGRSTMVVALTGPVVYKARHEDVIAIGAGVPAKLTVVRVPQNPEGWVTWRAAYNNLVVKSDRRARAVAQLMAEIAEPPGIVFVRYPEQAYRIAKHARGLGLIVDVVEGKTTSTLRERSRKALMRADVQWCVATKVWTEGTDVPGLRSVVIAGGGRSTIQTIQEAGRVLRAAEGKTHGAIYEIADVGHRSLERQAAERLAILKREGFDVDEEITL